MLIFALCISILNISITHSLLTRKKSIRFCIVTFILVTVLIFLGSIFITTHIHNMALWKGLVYFVAFLYIIYIHLVFEESISRKVFTMFSVWLFSTITLFIAIKSSELILGSKDIQNSIYIIRICIQVLGLVAAYRFIRKPYRIVLNLVPDKTIKYMSLYPIIAFFILITNFTTPLGRIRNFQSIYDMILFLAFIILGYVLVLTGIFSSSQIVNLKCSMEKLEWISNRDSLTGLYNRRYIMQKIEDEFIKYKTNKKKYSIIIADIDFFKKVNDNFGHGCGDQVLYSVR